MTHEEQTSPSRWQGLAFILLLGIMWLSLVTTEVAVAQCPMCKTALEKSAEGQQMASAFNEGILFLLSVPFVIIGMGTLLIYRYYCRHYRRLQGRGAESNSESDAERSSMPIVGRTLVRRIWP